MVFYDDKFYAYVVFWHDVGLVFTKRWPWPATYNPMHGFLPIDYIYSNDVSFHVVCPD
jgi:hypothetical protein